MTAVRLPAKLTRPRLYGATPRVRLFERLDAWADRPLVWVAGPPGSGKTTLVSSYLSQSRMPVLWYRLDADDVDAATFFSFLTQAARSVSRKRKLALPALTPEYLLDLPGFTRRYFRLLYEALPEGAAVVLDAYEAVSSSPIDALLGLGVAETPSGNRLLVTSRESPPAGLAHLETKGELGLVSWESLRLSEAEASAIAGAEAAAEVEDLRRYADGWAAGFVVVLDHVRRVGREALGSAGPVRESLFAYFVNEMFAQADESLRQLLLRTALLPGFTAAQAQALCAGIDASGLLERLYRRHYFLDRSTGAAPVYRYHALFQDFLVSQGRSLLGEVERRELLAQAAALLATDGRTEDALDLYTQAGCWAEAEGLICALGPGMLGEGRNAALANAIGALPAAVLEGSAWLQYWLGMARILFDPPAGQTLLEAAYAQFNAAGDHTGCVLACAGLCELYYLAWADMHPYREWAHRLDEHLNLVGSSIQPEIEIRAWCSLSTYFVVCGEADGGRLKAWNARSVKLALEVQEPNIKVALASSVSFPLFARGDWETIRRLVAAAGNRGVVEAIPPIYRILWHSTLCWMYQSQGQYVEASLAWQRGATVADQFGVRVLDVLIEGHGAHYAINARELDRSARHVQRMGALLAPSRTLDAANYEHMMSLLLVAQGNSALAVGYARAAIAKTVACGTPFLLAECRIGLASALLELGEFEEALSTAEAIGDYGKATGFRALQHAGMLLSAGALRGRGEREAALPRLLDALRLGRECDLGMMFPTAPERFLQQMFDLALSEGIERDYVRELIVKLKVPAPVYAAEYWPWPVRIFTLGRFQLDIEGTSIEHRRKVPKRPLALLKFLIARRGEARVDQAIDALWPDEEADAASNALDAALHRLRRLLGSAGAITLHDGLLGLDRSTIWVDALAFEEMLDRTGSEPDGSLARALSGYRGHFLASEAAEPWSVSMRERLRSRFIRAVAVHGEALREAEQFDAAAAHYARAIDVDDLIEAFYQGLMRCQLALGRRSEGLATWDRLSRALASGLALQPGPESRRLYEALRASH